MRLLFVKRMIKGLFMNPYMRDNEPKVKVATQTQISVSPVALIIVVLSLVVLLLSNGVASAP